MDSVSKLAGASVTPTKQRTGARSNRSTLVEKVRNAENYNPNVSSPGSTNSSKTPSVVKLDKSAVKSASRNPNGESLSSRRKIRGRKFVNVTKKSKSEETNCSTATLDCDICNKSKCLCVTEESLCASQDDSIKDGENGGKEGGVEDKKVKEDGVTGDENEAELSLKRGRDKVFEEIPEPRCGRVMNLVKAFENLSVVKLENSAEKVTETQISPSSFSPSELFLTSESLGLDSNRSHSLDSSHGRSISALATTSAAGQRSISGTESTGRKKWKRKQPKGPKSTPHKPFKLRTEQRGKCKEEEFMKKLQQMLEEEEKLRVPIAQGLPITIDEPECLVKPPVKEITRPVDLLLHSDIRAAERAEFDHQVAEKLSLVEQYRAERERQKKLEEEEEIKRLRKELVPKAQPMPYFDKPFVPKSSGLRRRNSVVHRS